MTEVTAVYSDHCEEVIAFLSTFPGFLDTREEWRARLHWWWDANPNFSADMIRGWALRDAGKIVGFMGSIPMRYLADGRETIAFAGTTWRVLAQYRGESIRIKQRQMADRKGSVQFATTPTPAVAALLKLFGSREIGQWQGGGEQSVVVTDFKSLLLRKFEQAPASKLCASFAAPAASLYQSILMRGLNRPSPFEVHELKSAGGEFDDLWNRSKDRYRNTNVRGRAEVNWYCSHRFGGEKLLLGAFRRNLCLGFMILLAEEESSIKLLRCIDLWVDPAVEQIEVVRALVARAVVCNRRRGFVSVVFPHFSGQLNGFYRRLKLPRRPEWHRREFISGPSEILVSMTSENTYLVGAQGDVGL